MATRKAAKPRRKRVSHKGRDSVPSRAPSKGEELALWRYWQNLPGVAMGAQGYEASFGLLAIDTHGRLVATAGFHRMTREEMVSVIGWAKEFDPALRRKFADRAIALWEKFAAGGDPL